MIDWPACFGSVEVDQMQPLDAIVRPASSHLNRIVTENRFLVVIALPESDALSASKVHCGKNLHGEWSLFQTVLYGLSYSLLLWIRTQRSHESGVWSRDLHLRNMSETTSRFTLKCCNIRHSREGGKPEGWKSLGARLRGHDVK